MSVVPSQILYLENSTSRLYAEVIQIVEQRHLCWARPTLLIQGLPADHNQPFLGSLTEQAEEKVEDSLHQAAIATAAAEKNPAGTSLDLYSLEDCPDLIWPLALFKIACDIDFFSLLLQLKANPDAIAQRNASSQLNAFIHSFWHTYKHTHKDVFSACTE